MPVSGPWHRPALWAIARPERLLLAQSLNRVAREIRTVYPDFPAHVQADNAHPQTPQGALSPSAEGKGLSDEPRLVRLGRSVHCGEHPTDHLEIDGPARRVAIKHPGRNAPVSHEHD